MPRTEETIEQLRFLAENWHRFSSWTRVQIIVTIWWYVKVRRPLRRLAKRLGNKTVFLLFWLPVVLLLGLSFITLSRSATPFQPHIPLALALMVAAFLLSLSAVHNGK
jgi:hypothetical protein